MSDAKETHERVRSDVVTHRVAVATADGARNALEGRLNAVERNVIQVQAEFTNGLQSLREEMRADRDSIQKQISDLGREMRGYFDRIEPHDK